MQKTSPTNGGGQRLGPKTAAVSISTTKIPSPYSKRYHKSCYIIVWVLMEIVYSIFIGIIVGMIVGINVGIVLQCRRGMARWTFSHDQHAFLFD